MGGKGIDRRRLEWQKQLEEEDTIIAKREQEDVETLYNLLNNNNPIFLLFYLKFWAILLYTFLDLKWRKFGPSPDRRNLD